MFNFDYRSSYVGGVNMQYIQIAIDGPGAAGKSTVAKRVAKQLHYTYIDTGAMYRCLALFALRNHIEITDEDALCQAISKMQISLTNDGKVFLNQEDVTKTIRLPDVTAIVSPVSRPRKVRELLVKKQQELAKTAGGVVMDGRDIGTVVLPNAELKIFQVASCEIRAKRRHEENLEKGISSSLETIIEEIKRRDYSDIHKEFGALKKADDAIEIDTSYLTIEEVVDFIVDKAKELIK